MIDSEAILPANLFANDQCMVTARQRLERAIAESMLDAQRAAMAGYECGLRDAARLPIAKRDGMLHAMINGLDMQRNRQAAS